MYHGDRGNADGLEAVRVPGGTGTIKHLPVAMTKGGAFLHGQSDQLKLCCGDNMKKLEIAFTDTSEKVVIDEISGQKDIIFVQSD